jgi:hypothetical protein
MKKIFAVLLLASATVVSCSGKKASTTPSATDKASPETKGDAAGGAMYGGHKDAAPTGKDTPNPCSSK